MDCFSLPANPPGTHEVQFKHSTVIVAHGYPISARFTTSNM
jgi:hypothetical protein